MTEKFDPYYKWLGIPPRDQPPHNYRLLGIEVFENDRDVIDAAANRVMAYLKDLATGDDAEYSQSLLNEVARARICLLNRDKKKAYDKELRADLDSKSSPDPKAGKPSARPPAKKRKEASEEDAPPLQPPPEAPLPKIQVDGPKPKSAADPAVLAEADDSDDEQPAKLIRWKLIAAAGVGGVLLAAAIVLAVFHFFGSDDDQVASALNGEVQGGPDSPTTNGEDPGSEDDPESDPDSGTETDPETDPEMDPGASTKPETEPETDPAPDSKARTEPAADPDAGDPSGSGAKPKTEPDSSTPPDVKSDLPDWSPGEEPGDGTSTGNPSADGTTAPKDTEPSADDTMPAKVDVPEVDPPQKKPIIPKPPAKPAKKPFEEFPELVSLPDLESADAMIPKDLGPIYVAPDELCFIKLRGGEKASKGSERFLMRNADGGLAERDWEILWREGESDPETKIAHLSLGDSGQLNFQWQPEAKTQPLSSYVTNCALSLSCSGESHIVVLRQVTQVEGMTLELDKPSTDEHWKIDMAPDPAAVRIEIAGVQGAEYTVQPAPVIEANRGETWIDLQDGGGMLSLKVETEMKRNVAVTVTPHLKTPPDGRPQKFNARQFAQILNQRKTQLAQSPVVIQQMKQFVNQASGPQKRLAEQQLALAEQTQVELQTAVENAQKLEEFLRIANGNLQVQFRVFYDADSSEVDLLRIGG